MLQDDESLALALRGGLRGRFQGTFNQLENAVEVLDDYMLQHLNPAEYADLRTMMRDIKLAQPESEVASATPTWPSGPISR